MEEPLVVINDARTHSNRSEYLSQPLQLLVVVYWHVNWKSFCLSKFFSSYRCSWPWGLHNRARAICSVADEGFLFFLFFVSITLNNSDHILSPMVGRSTTFLGSCWFSLRRRWQQQEERGWHCQNKRVRTAVQQQCWVLTSCVVLRLGDIWGVVFGSVFLITRRCMRLMKWRKNHYTVPNISSHMSFLLSTHNLSNSELHLWLSLPYRPIPFRLCHLRN